MESFVIEGKRVVECPHCKSTSMCKHSVKTKVDGKMIMSCSYCGTGARTEGRKVRALILIPPRFGRAGQPPCAD